MRDILVTLIVLGSVPITFLRPYIGILVGTWLSLMSPHKMSWGFAQTLRVALIVGVATLISWVLSKEPKRPPGGAIVLSLAALTVWVVVCMPFAIVPDLAWEKFSQVIKILLLTFVAMAVIHGKDRIQLLVWVTAMSIGFYGFRGGVFTILNGGEYRVWGPPGTFIEDNNQLGLALAMVLPLFYYLQLTTTRRWVKLGLWGIMGLTLLAILGTYSRGALVSLAVVMPVLWWRTPRRLLTGAIFAAALGGALFAAPDKWVARMQSTADYEQDESAQGRFDAWLFAWKVASDHPLVGGGFRVFYDKKLFFAYVPGALKERTAHSIYFEALGEMGFVGLFLFLALGASALLTTQRIISLARERSELRWAADLGRMTQVSLLGYATAGAFVNLGFFDLYYTILVVIVATNQEVKLAIAQQAPQRAAGRQPLTGLRPRQDRMASPLLPGQ